MAVRQQHTCRQAGEAVRQSVEDGLRRQAQLAVGGDVGVEVERRGIGVGAAQARSTPRSEHLGTHVARNLARDIAVGEELLARPVYRSQTITGLSRFCLQKTD